MSQTAQEIRHEWDRKNLKSFLLKYGKADADVIERLQSVPNRNDYIRQLVRADINKK